MNRVGGPPTPARTYLPPPGTGRHRGALRARKRPTTRHEPKIEQAWGLRDQSEFCTSRRPFGQRAYVASWIKAIKKGKNEIFRAAADASQACDYLLEREREKPEAATHAERVTAETQECRALQR